MSRTGTVVSPGYFSARHPAERNIPLVFVVVLILSLGAAATNVPVNNPSFETNNGFNVSCGGTCEYSVGLPIPGWNTSGLTGQWITGGYNGNPPAFDGQVLAYSDGGLIWQDVGSATAGTTYSLNVEVLHRTDEGMGGVVQLEIGGVVVATGSGPDAGPGTWNLFNTTYTATGGDAGQTVTILLSENGADQVYFDAVSLNANSPVTGTPEPSSLALLTTGLLAGLSTLRRKLLR